MPKSFPSLALAIVMAALPVHAQTPTDSGGGPVRKKLIELGWGAMTPGRLLENLARVEQTPFDGTALKISGTDDAGKPVGVFQTCIPRPWKAEWFNGEIETLRKLKSARLTENFASVSLSVSKGDFADAFDDEGWKTIAEHFRIVARIAKQGGLRGLMFDPEGYGATVISSRSRTHPEKSFEEYAAKVRQRGREMMAAMAGEYPDMVFFTLFMNSGTALGALGGDPRETMERNERYSLYPALVNGWLDAVPPTVTIVDGFEMAYPHSDEAQYLKHVNGIRNTTVALVSPENRLKYRGQVQAGLALYMDAFAGAPKSDVHADVYLDPPLTGTIVERLQQAAGSALDAADEYVWIYGEQYRWWPDSEKPDATRYWDEIMPGVTAALAAAKDPLQRSLMRADREFAVSERKAAIHETPLRNLLKNGDFANGSTTKYAPPAAASRGSLFAKEAATDWQIEVKSGAGQRALTGCAGYGSACLAGAEEGAFTQEVKATPATPYKVRVQVRQSGAGEATLRVAWHDAEGHEIGAAQSFAPKLSPRDQWAQISGTVRAPAGAATLVVRLTATGEKTEKDLVWFDDAEVFQISVN